MLARRPHLLALYILSLFVQYSNALPTDPVQSHNVEVQIDQYADKSLKGSIGTSNNSPSISSKSIWSGLFEFFNHMDDGSALMMEMERPYKTIFGNGGGGGGEKGQRTLSAEKGWLARWLTVGGEGVVTVMLPSENITFPHRPAAFPSHLAINLTLPTGGFLRPFHLLPPLRSTQTQTQDEAANLNSDIHIQPIDPSSGGVQSPAPGTTNDHPDIACISPAWPPIRFHPPKSPYLIALVERGGCDFASKVLAAQERGAGAVVVGDGIAKVGETDEEGREREGLITMFSPDTEGIFIPSVFVSRSSYLSLLDMLKNGTSSNRQDGQGIYIHLSESTDEGGALSTLLSFALLMPSIFLLITVAIHRIRVARQREADRAPPLLVLSLPERIWTPDIVWEKDDEESDETPTSPNSPTSPTFGINHPHRHSSTSTITPSVKRSVSGGGAAPEIPPPPPISPAEIRTPPVTERPDDLPPLPHTSSSRSIGGAGGATSSKLIDDVTGKTKRTKSRSKNGTGKKYFSKDECAICMDSFQKGDVVRILPCGHVFHKEECDEWLMKWRKLCPTCRADVTLPSSPPGSVMGATVTPVAIADPAHPETQDQGRTFGERLSSGIRALRTKLFARQPPRTGEQTPLLGVLSDQEV